MIRFFFPTKKIFSSLVTSFPPLSDPHLRVQGPDLVLEPSVLLQLAKPPFVALILAGD